MTKKLTKKYLKGGVYISGMLDVLSVLIGRFILLKGYDFSFMPYYCEAAEKELWLWEICKKGKHVISTRYVADCQPAETKLEAAQEAVDMLLLYEKHIAEGQRPEWFGQL